MPGNYLPKLLSILVLCLNEGLLTGMILDFLKSKPKRYLGVDIGTSSIKLIELSKEKDRVKLEAYGQLSNYGSIERIGDAIQTSSLAMLDSQVAQMISFLMREAKTRTNRAIVSVPLFSAFVTIMEFPVMSEKEIGQAVPYEAKQYVPIPLAEVILDWQILGTVRKNASLEGASNIDKTLVLLVAVPQEVVNKYKRIAKLAGINLQALELETLGMIRSVIGVDKTPLVLVDIGGRNTSMGVVEGGVLRMTHSIDTSGADITQTIAQGLNINLLRAESLKKERGIVIAPGEEDVKILITTLLDVIIAEIERIMGLYSRRYGTKIEKIVLCGGTANLPGLLEYFKEHFQFDISIGNAFKNVVYPEILNPLIIELSPVFATSIGLAMREII